MKYKVNIRPEAEQDLETAYAWYEDRQVGLGNRFLFQIKESLDFIACNPQASPVIYRETRKHILKKFPFKIIYLTHKDKIDVLAVLHGKQHPNRAKNRVNQYFIEDELNI